MAMTFVDDLLTTVEFSGFAAFLELARIDAKAHGAAFSVTSSWSGMRSMTGYWVSGMNSEEFAPVMPHTFLANSMTAHCIPRQRPRNGILLTRAYLMVSILPSTPR